MKTIRLLQVIAMSLMALFLQNCIHEYPVPLPGIPGQPGEDPTTFNTYIEISYDLNWETMLHHIDFDGDSRSGDKREVEISSSGDSRAREEIIYRMVYEVILDDSVVCRDEIEMPASQFSLGHQIHRLSKPLGNQYYQLAVWFERMDEEGFYPFNADILSEVTHLNRTTSGTESLECGFAADILDLREISSTEKEIKKSLSLHHAGAKFEIIATDIQDFINSNRDALYQGEEYTVHLSFNNPISQSFSLHGNEYIIKEIPGFELSGRMRLPYAEYEELKIAEGFLFSREQDNANLILRVSDTALTTVAHTSSFSFPIKRGYLTRVRGDFLTGSVDGSLSVDHVWEGEIVIDVNDEYIE